MTSALRGQRAPDFLLPRDPENHFLARSDLSGKPAMLVFYPADWSPVCGNQLALDRLRTEAA